MSGYVYNVELTVNTGGVTNVIMYHQTDDFNIAKKMMFDWLGNSFDLTQVSVSITVNTGGWAV